METDAITKWVVDNWPLILAVLGILDALAGKIPDKYVSYIGVIRRVLQAIGKKGNSGKSSLAYIVWLALSIGMLCTILAYGCANMPSENKLSAARIIARNAGYYMADNNAKIAERIVIKYDAIKAAEGVAYQESIRSLLSQILMDNEVRNSKRLMADAMDILSLFGVPIPNPDNVTLEWVQGIDIVGLRAVSEAFVEGLNG